MQEEGIQARVLGRLVVSEQRVLVAGERELVIRAFDQAARRLDRVGGQDGRTAHDLGVVPKGPSDFTVFASTPGTGVAISA